MDKNKKIVLLSGVGAEIAPLKTTHIGRIFRIDNFNPVLAFKEALLDGLLVSLGTKTKITEQDVDSLTVMDLRMLMFHIRLISYPPNHVFNIVANWKDKDGNEFSDTTPIVVNESLMKAQYSAGANKDKPIYATYQDFLQKERDYILPDSGFKVRLSLLLVKDLKREMDNENASFLSIIKQRNPVLVREDGEVESLVYDFEDRISSIMDLEFLFDKIFEQEGFAKVSIEITNPKNPKQTQSADLLSMPNFFFPSLSKLL